MKCEGRLRLSLRGFSRSNPVDNNSLLDRVAPLAMTKGIMLAITALIALAGGGLLFVDTPTLADNPETITVSAEIEPALKLEISNCDLAQVDETKLKIPDVAPTQGFSSTCQTLSISTNRPGYELIAKVASSDPNYNSGDPTNDLLYTDDPTTRNPIPAIPITSSPITNPASLTPNHWGFAITSGNSTINTTLPVSNFDSPTTYANTASAAKYANLPTTDTQVYQTNQTTTELDVFEFYYAVAINTSQAAGTYANLITYSAIGAIVPCPWDNSISFDNPDCVEPTLACQSGNEAKNLCQVDLDTNMIPVKYTGDNTTPQWSKASPTEANGAWYDYEQQRWANAVTVTSGTLDAYKNAPIGTVLLEQDILGYWVYIPRYEYQVCRPNATDPITLSAGQCQDGSGNDVLNTATPYNFNIRFQKSDDVTMFDGVTVGDWVTHPAFTFGSTQLNGIWISKFEASSPVSSRATSASGIYFKPNQLGVSSNDVSSQFQMSLDISTSGANAHNLATATSHLQKNSEWGAIAYLSTSLYGRGTSEMAVNACDDDTYNPSMLGGNDTVNDHTGWGGGSADCSVFNSDSLASDGVYNGSNGVHASTTDNVYGVYDMSGGNWDNVMGSYNNTVDLSGFSPMPDAKYFNSYMNSIFSNNNYYTSNNQCTWAACGGHALHETKAVQPVVSASQSWGGDYSYFVASGADGPWFRRGGNSVHGTNAGVFASGSSKGSAYYGGGFRVSVGAF